MKASSLSNVAGVLRLRMMKLSDSDNVDALQARVVTLR